MSYEGVDGRECGEHHSTGQRAWCFADSEWCTPNAPCRGCELPGLRVAITRAAVILRRLGDDLGSFSGQYDLDADERALVAWLEQYDPPATP